jgi:cyclopropane fatty-acyl-phospholipid synthase-like methyltransferase
LRTSPIALHTDDANNQHYQVPSEFFETVLGKRLKYSCAYWSDETANLDDAEVRMLQLSCARARIENGQDILDLGCGWGSLSLYIAETYPDCQVTGVSNSKTQRQFIEKRIREKNLSNLQIITADMNHFSIDKQFDCIMSLEMFEHMRNYQQLLEKVASFMKPDALLFIHIFTHNKFTYPFETNGQNDWMARNFFTGGIMPSKDLLLDFQDHVTLTDSWQVNGSHYQNTSEAWLENMDANRDKVLAMFENHGDRNTALKQMVNWRVFFMACAELFGYNNGNEWQVTHYLFEKKAP